MTAAIHPASSSFAMAPVPLVITSSLSLAAVRGGELRLFVAPS